MGIESLKKNWLLMTLLAIVSILVMFAFFTWLLEALFPHETLPAYRGPGVIPMDAALKGSNVIIGFENVYNYEDFRVELKFSHNTKCRNGQIQTHGEGAFFHGNFSCKIGDYCETTIPLEGDISGYNSMVANLYRIDDEIDKFEDRCINFKYRPDCVDYLTWRRPGKANYHLINGTLENSGGGYGEPATYC